MRKEGCTCKNRLVFIIDNFNSKISDLAITHLLKKLIYLSIYLYLSESTNATVYINPTASTTNGTTATTTKKILIPILTLTILILQN